MTWNLQEGIVGAPQVSPFFNYVSTTPQQPPGFLLAGYDSWWGGGEFIYGRANGTIRHKGLVVVTPTFDSTSSTWRYEFTEAPNTANLGRTLAVAMVAMASGDYGWFQIGGVTPVDCQAAVAADTTFGIAAAGQGGANSAGKQILNARVIGASTTTVAKANCAGVSGSTVIDVPSTDGWFPGVFLSGTGVGAAARVASIMPSGRQVVATVANSAQISGTVTATYNNATIFYNVAHLNRPFAQGAIT